MDDEDAALLSAVLKGVDITEVYSQERVVKVGKKFGLIRGDSIDLRTGFDLSDPAVQRQVAKRIGDTRPKCLIVCPPCTKFSTLQELNIAVHGPAW